CSSDLIDTPGRGSSLRFKEMYSRYDYEVPVKAIFDYLETRNDVETDRMGLAGVSFGGYYAPGAAAFGPRVKAVAAWRGTWSILTDVYEGYRPLQQQRQWLPGTTDDADARAKLAAVTLENVVDKLDMPVYVMHGENDIVMNVEGARRFINELDNDDVTADFYAGAGSMHCNDDYLAVAAARLTDWFTH